MGQHPLDLLAAEIELVLPEVAVLQVAVLAHLEVIRQHREDAGIAAEQPLQHVQEAACLVGAGGEIDRVGEKPGALVLARGIHAQQRVAIHRPGVVDVGGGEHERELARVDRGTPFPEARAFAARNALRVEAQLGVQPCAPRGEPALGMIVAFGCFREKAA